MGALILTTLALAWLVYLAFNNDLGDFSDDSSPRLHFSWQALSWVAAESGWLGKLLAGVIAVIAWGAEYLAGIHKRLWHILAVALICLTGAGLSILLMFLIDTGDTLTTLRSFTDLDNAAMNRRLDGFLGGLIVWFAVFLTVLLHVSWVKPTGTISKWLSEGGRSGPQGADRHGGDE
ncbi:hypothetical protein DL238_05640 [Alteriqipengyuania lutimaris]|uniref:Uncharacterized protein n=1 Tax=Alteriqipengyuania lutimaris TaxID=1538146 RepID=A0A395LKA4_9SPHN|nr:hypothetical protein DL238_05640 [Alteriqipengyuania lutimaris]